MERKKSLGDRLEATKVPGLYGIDTCELIMVLRESGTTKGKIVFGNDHIAPNLQNLEGTVSQK